MRHNKERDLTGRRADEDSADEDDSGHVAHCGSHAETVVFASTRRGKVIVANRTLDA